MRRGHNDTVKMIAKKDGVCVLCGKPIIAGNPIFWRRGEGAWHTDCRTAGFENSQCTVCKGSGRLWNNAPCRQCDGTGSRVVEDFARAGGHPRKDAGRVAAEAGAVDVDRLYEDSCQRQCGL